VLLLTTPLTVVALDPIKVTPNKVSLPDRLSPIDVPNPTVSLSFPISSIAYCPITVLLEIIVDEFVSEALYKAS
jgi:hypothetical protein